MKFTGRANTLLLELLLVLLCFMIASVTLVELFGAARMSSQKAKTINQAMLESQNVAEKLYTSSDSSAELKSLGFTEYESGWRKEHDRYSLIVMETTELKESGMLYIWTIEAVCGDESLLTLPSIRYRPEDKKHE